MHILYFCILSQQKTKLLHFQLHGIHYDQLCVYIYLKLFRVGYFQHRIAIDAEMKVCVLMICLFGVAMVDGCPTWFTNTTGSCECGNELDGYVKCYQDMLKVDVRLGCCMTLFNNNSVVAGICRHAFTSNITSRVYSSVPDDPAQLDSKFCAPYNRRGFLCGECIDGYGPSPFYSDFCANCSDLNLVAAICLYLFLTLFPTTLFFFIVLVFHLNVTTGPLLGYILFCQAHVITLADQFYLISSIELYLPSPLLFIFHSSLFLSGIWSLKFFQFIAPPICISSKMTGIHVQMLSFITPIFLLFLFVITYFIMDCNMQHTARLPRSVKLISTYFTKLKHKINANNSVIHAFATFIFLSMAGIIYETFAMTAGNSVHNVNGSIAITLLYRDPTIISNSDVHLLYMICPLVLLFLLVLCPSLLLCIYPTRVYERLSRHVSPRKRLVFKIFAESFQSCFKDGLDGTFDYRMIPSAIILISVLFATLLSYVPIALPISLGDLDGNNNIIVRFFCVSLSLIISFLQPCKSFIMNRSLSFHTTLLGFLGILLGMWIENVILNTKAVAIAFAILPVFPHTVIMMWGTYKIICRVESRGLPNLHNFKRICFMLKNFMKGNNKYEEIGAGGNSGSQQLQIP